MKRKEEQSAVELLSVYGLVLLVIATVLSVLLIFSSAPETLLPTQCVAYSGFKCLDTGLFPITTSQTQFEAIAVDTQAGVINITGFSATFGFTQSVSGSCTPNRVSEGETVYCTATLDMASKLGESYTGTYQLSADYCANGPANINATCPGSSSFQYGGGARIVASSAVDFVTYEISNMQSVTVNVMLLDGTEFGYSQLPLTKTYSPGTTHSLLFTYTIPTSTSQLYVFSSISGCGVNSIGTNLKVSSTCTVVATYNTINYGSCPSIPDKGGENLMDVVARYCDLVGYDMAGDNLNGANVFGSDLQDADLAGANLNDANLSAANMENTVMTGVNFNDEIMVGAQLQGLTALSGSNFNNANMLYVDMEGADVTGANFQGAKLQYANLQNGDYDGSNFQNANLTNADMEGSNTVGASFSGANIVGCSGCP